MKQPLILSLTVALLFGIVSQAAAQDATYVSRKWQSKDGQHELHAAFLRYDQASREVFLKSDAGKEFSVSIDDLSTKDKSYVASFIDRPETPKPKPKKEEPQVEPAADVKTSGDADNNAQSFQRFGVNWVSDLDRATELARGNDATKDDRPIMMFRVLGDLTGFM